MITELLHNQELANSAASQLHTSFGSDNYTPPLVVALGNLESVQAERYSKYYDGPNTTYTRD